MNWLTGSFLTAFVTVFVMLRQAWQYHLLGIGLAVGAYVFFISRSVSRPGAKAIGIWGLIFAGIFLIGIRDSFRPKDRQMCELHGVKMDVVPVKIIYGDPAGCSTPAACEQRRTYYSAASKSFPHAASIVNGGGVVLKNTGTGYVCKRCLENKTNWIKTTGLKAFN